MLVQFCIRTAQDMGVISYILLYALRINLLLIIKHQNKFDSAHPYPEIVSNRKYFFCALDKVSIMHTTTGINLTEDSV